MPEKMNGYEEEIISSTNPLVFEIHKVQRRIVSFKRHVKDFYFEVLLSQFTCPKCKGKLSMTDQCTCFCEYGHSFDPTIMFQRSGCCQADIFRKRQRYACVRCNKITPSRFLFDERLFDKDYFREMMQISRARAKKRREKKILELLTNRSGDLVLLQEPKLELIPGLTEDLDAFVGRTQGSAKVLVDIDHDYAMDDYRVHILKAIEFGSRLFSGIPSIADDRRKDKVFRFVTLVFMQHEREVVLTQLENDLRIEGVELEAY